MWGGRGHRGRRQLTIGAKEMSLLPTSREFGEVQKGTLWIVCEAQGDFSIERA